MDKEKHTTTSFCGLDKISKRINDPHFKDLEELRAILSTSNDSGEGF